MFFLNKEVRFPSMSQLRQPEYTHNRLTSWWNQLLLDIRCCDTVNIFKSKDFRHFLVIFKVFLPYLNVFFGPIIFLAFILAHR